MYPEKLPNNDHYRFTNAEVFPKKLNLLYGFTEENYSKDMHFQEFYEINIVLSGEGMHYVGDGRLTVSKGDVFIIPPYLVHGYVGSEGFNVYHIVLAPAFFEKYSSDLRLLPSFSAMFHAEPAMRGRYNADLHLKLTSEETDGLLPTLDEINRRAYASSPEDIITCRSLTMMLIARLCTGFDLARKHRPAAESDEAFMQSIAMIYERYYERLTIERLCTAARMSRSAYLRRFKEFTGTSPGEYVQRRRLEAAANMLENTASSVSEIAAQTGFYDAPHFIRHFEARFGTSPLEYRKAHTER